MYRLYQKKEILFAVLWIVIYCVLLTPLKGTYGNGSLPMLAGLAVIAVVLTIFVKRHHLEEKYGPPRGRLYLARWGGETAGCIALRPLDEHRCEMKRLYVRPAFRNRGIARKLVDTILADARSIGYHEMLLDTLPFLTEAIAMYEGLGFVRTECYNDSPLADTVYMKLTL